jgi:hypothetical protein
MKRIILAAVAGIGLVGIGYAAGAKVEKADRYFEMRTYIANPGKMSALHARFRDHTNKLFQKHGIQLVGYWNPVGEGQDGNTLVFILGYPSKDDQAKMWKAFAEDPEWKKAKAESEKDGVLVLKATSVFMNPTDYSPIK